MPVLQPRAPQIDSQVWSSGCLHLWILVAFSAAWRGRWEMREEGGEGDDKGEGGEGPVSASPIPRAQAGDRWQLLALVRCQGLQQTKRFSWFWQRAVTHHLLFRWPDVEEG